MSGIRLSRALLVFMAALPAVACSDDDATGPRTVAVSGTVKDYFSKAAIDSVELSLDGHSSVNPIAAPNGQFDLSLSISTGELVTIVATREGYRPTRNPGFTAGSNTTVSLHAVSEADIARQYVAVAATPTPGTGVVIAELVDESGTPREGIPVSDILLVDTQGPVGVGPFVFGSSGDIEPQSTLNETTAIGGQSRIAFLEVPPGEYSLTIQTTTGVAVLAEPANVDPDGATLVGR